MANDRLQEREVERMGTAKMARTVYMARGWEGEDEDNGGLGTGGQPHHVIVCAMNE